MADTQQATNPEAVVIGDVPFNPEQQGRSWVWVALFNLAEFVVWISKLAACELFHWHNKTTGFKEKQHLLSENALMAYLQQQRQVLQNKQSKETSLLYAQAACVFGVEGMSKQRKAIMQSTAAPSPMSPLGAMSRE
jgi:hypothetical protein